MAKLSGWSLLLLLAVTPQALAQSTPLTPEEKEMLVEVRQQWKVSGLGEMTAEQESTMVERFRTLRGTLTGNLALTQAAAKAPIKPASSMRPPSPPIAPAATASSTATKAAPLAPADATDPDAYIYIAPGDVDPDRGIACGVSIGFRDTISGGAFGLAGPNGISGDVQRTGPNEAVVTTLRGDTNLEFGRGVKTKASVVVDKTDQQCKLTIRTLDSEPYKKGVLGIWKEPDFNADYVLTSPATFYYHMSLDSPFPATSVEANFRRMAQCWDVNDRDGKGLRCAISGPAEAFQATVKCFPYRAGSKCEMDTTLKPVKNGRTFDASQAGTAFREAVSKIIND